MRKSGHHVSIQWLELCEALMRVRTPFESMVNETAACASALRPTRERDVTSAEPYVARKWHWAASEGWVTLRGI
jgi:hypothetical protein